MGKARALRLGWGGRSGRGYERGGKHLKCKYIKYPRKIKLKTIKKKNRKELEKEERTCLLRVLTSRVEIKMNEKSQFF